MTKFLRPSALPAGFDADFYLKTYPDVALSGLSPDYHYLHYGSVLGRKISASAHPVLGMALAPAAARALSPAAPPTASSAPRGPAAQAVSSSVSPAPGTSAPVSSASPAAAHAPPPQAKTAAPSAAPSAAALAAAWQGASPDALPPALLDALYAQGPIPISGPEQHGELVTIILPSYNNAPYLARAIHSALSQTGVRIELIVVDDGSTDASVAIASRIAEGVGAGRMKVISLLRNFGCYYARNIGVMEAKGDYITIIDSDDIMSPDRILRQMDALKAAPEARACLAQLRRWTADYSQPLNHLRYAENTLLWRRELIEKIGYYDTVRFGADGEFRFRLQRTFGSAAVVRIADELHFTRTLLGSLTTSAKSRVFALDGAQLSVQLSKPRQQYDENYTGWQRSQAASKRSMKLDFPQFSRAFDLGEAAQNASPSLGQRRVGAMASYPPRRDGLAAVVASILPQLDELILYLNDYPDVPGFLQDPKIRVVRSQQAMGDLRDNGKFYDLPQQDAYIFTFDDDLIYPADYVARMVHQIEMLGRGAVVGVHGVNFPEGEFTDLRQRQVHMFSGAHHGSFVDLLGTGTTAWHASTLAPKPADFGSTGVCDLWFTALATRRGVPLFCVQRPEGWLKVLHRFEESLWLEAWNAPQGYFEIYRSIVAPAQRVRRTRLEAERAMISGYDRDTLLAAGVVPALVSPRRILGQSTHGAQRSAQIRDILSTKGAVQQAAPPFEFEIVVNGWNCKDDIDRCLRSIAQQQPGPYRYRVTLVDDGSEDGSGEKLEANAILPGARLIRIAKNAGPAHARHIAVREIRDPEAIVVLIDMDDMLEPQALRVVAERYAKNPACLMTIGNWHDQHGKKNPQSFYSAEEINGQSIRSVELFNATHLRTFRRKLYDAITEDDLLGPDGRWLETCTDVALMYPLMDQCWSEEIEFIAEPIYRYNRQHSSGTLARFGKPHKVERLAFLKAKPPKPRLHPERPQRLAAQ